MVLSMFDFQGHHPLIGADGRNRHHGGHLMRWNPADPATGFGETDQPRQQDNGQQQGQRGPSLGP